MQPNREWSPAGRFEAKRRLRASTIILVSLLGLLILAAAAEGLLAAVHTSGRS